MSSSVPQRWSGDYVGRDVIRDSAIVPVALDGNGIGRYMGLVEDPTFKPAVLSVPFMKAGDTPLLRQRDNFYPVEAQPPCRPRINM